MTDTVGAIPSIGLPDNAVCKLRRQSGLVEPYPATDDATAGAAITSAVADAQAGGNATFAIPFTDHGGAATFNIAFNGTTTGSITYSSTVATLLANINAVLITTFGQIPTFNPDNNGEINRPGQIIASGASLAAVQLACSGSLYRLRSFAVPTVTVLTGTGFTPGTATLVTQGQAGDEIEAYRYLATSSNLAKTGLRYNFHDNLLVNSSNLPGFTFSDASGPMVLRVRNGRFLRTLSLADASIAGLDTIVIDNPGVVYVSDPSSVVEIFDSELMMDFPAGSINVVSGSGDYEAPVVVTDGRFDTNNCDLVCGNNAGTARAVLMSAIYWVNGEVNINGGKIYATTPIDSTSILIWCGTTDATKGAMYIDVDLIDAGNDSAAIIGGDSTALSPPAVIDPKATVWIDTNIGHGIIEDFGGGKIYWKSEKHYGSIDQQHGELHYVTEKMGGFVNTVVTGFYIIVSGSGTKFWGEINKFDPASVASFCFASAGAVAFIEGIEFTIPSGKIAFEANGAGTILNVVSGNITGSAVTHFYARNSATINVYLEPGQYDVTKIITETGGTVNLLGSFIPTSDPHVLGATWRNSGVLTASGG